MDTLINIDTQNSEKQLLFYKKTRIIFWSSFYDEDFMMKIDQ